MQAELTRSNNNFDLIRIAAALMVFISHCFALMGLKEPILINSTAEQPEINLGTLGVSIFFSTSGFLVSHSLINSKNIIKYLLKRFFRIYPAFWVNILIIIFIIGPIFSNLSFTEYFRLVSLNYLDYLKCFFGIFGFSLPNLPGVFTKSYYSDPNSPLWTLYPEIRCYIILASLYLFKILDIRFLTLICFLLITSINLYLTNSFESVALIHSYIFILSSIIYLIEDQKSIKYAFLSLILILLTLMLNLNMLIISVYITIVPLLTIYLGLIKKSFYDVEKYGDLSYGIYLYAWPMQQVFAEYYDYNALFLSPFIIFSFILTYLFALISWNFIEKVAVKHGRAFSYKISN